MNEDFVPFEIAKKLKEKGFKRDCIAYYMPHSDELIYNVQPYKGVTLYSFNSLRKELISSDFMDAPIISQVLKWLREEKKIEVIPSFDYVERTWGYQVGDMTLRGDVILAYLWGFKTYEAAALAGIEYCLDNLI